MRLILECQHDPKTLLRQIRPVPNDSTPESLTAVITEMMAVIETERKEIDAHRRRAFKDFVNTTSRFRHKKASGRPKVNPEMELGQNVSFEPLPEGL